MPVSGKYIASTQTVRALKLLISYKKGITKKELFERLDLNNPYQLMAYLRKSGYIKTTPINGQELIAISKKGNSRLEKINLTDLSLKTPPKWDGYWRLVFFDIPEKYKQSRFLLVTKLKELGFKQIQKSIYIHPYPCLREIEIIRKGYRIENYVFCVTINEIEGSKKLKRIFQIK